MPRVSAAEERAYARAAAHVRSAAGALGMDFEALDAAYGQTMAADDPTDGGPAGRVFVAAKWWLPTGTDPATLDTVTEFWRRGGYDLIADGRRDPLPYVWAEDPTDGYRVGLDTNAQGRLVLGASSPLFWSEGEGP